MEYCYKSSGAANKMTRREALQGYNDTISGLMATYANDVPNQQFVLNHWPDALLLIMDKQCSLTGNGASLYSLLLSLLIIPWRKLHLR